MISHRNKIILQVTLIEEIAPSAKEMACRVRGYHIYKDTWEAATGEVLVCSREPTNVAKFLL